MEGVLVTGTATAALEGECVRCLEPITDELSARSRALRSTSVSEVIRSCSSRAAATMPWTSR